MSEFRAGVIGFGYMGKLHAEAFAKMPRVSVTAIADSNAQLEPKLPSGAKLFTDYRELLASNVDVVSICLPTHLHCAVALDALVVRA